jgi:hypothetical protein
MAETMERTTTQGGVLDPVTYWRVSAFLLTLVALLGAVLDATGNASLFGAHVLAFDWPHNLLHGVLALAAFVFGFAALPLPVVRLFAIVFGVVYAGLGVVGFLVDQIGAMHLEVGENVLHLLLGAWAVAAGVAAKPG